MSKQSLSPRHPLRILVFLFLLLIGSTVSGQGFLRVEGTRIVNEKGQNVLLRGMGLGGWMLQEGYMLKVRDEGQQHKFRARLNTLIGKDSTQAFYDAWLANHTRRIDIDSMKAWGFNSVRLPMHYNLFTLPVEKEKIAGSNTWLEKGFRMVDSLLDWCRDNRMYLILDLHAAPGGQGNDLNISDRDPSKPSLWESAANRQKTIALWKKIAQRYVSEPWIGAYDILNEPNWGFTDPVNDKNGLKENGNAPLRSLMMDITSAIREADTNHIIIIEGNGWGNNYNGIFPVWDNNLVVSFHKYWNYNDKASIKHILDTREQQNVPVWLGETGENSNVWFRDAVKLLEDHNIGWAWWPLKKLGSNNPMEILSNPGYERILAWWAGRGPQPSEKEAYDGIMKLAEDTRLENTRIKRDVLDALLRQPHDTSAIPFRHHRLTDDYMLPAVEYDLGGNGIAYYDLDTADYHVSTGVRTAGNRGRMYRNDGVDIAPDSLQQDQYIVNHIEAGEWLQYTIEVGQTAGYNITLAYRAPEAHAQILLQVNHTPATHKLTLAQSLQWSASQPAFVRLHKGKNVLRLHFQTGDLSIRSISFTRSSR